MFRNFHDFAIRLYRKRLITVTQPAQKAINAYFGESQTCNDETFSAVTQWFTYAYAALYSCDVEYKSHWREWYKGICKRTAQYGKEDGLYSMKLNISGRTAQKGMETVDKNLIAFDQAIRWEIDEQVNKSATDAEKAALVDRRIQVLEATLPEQELKLRTSG
jgi:hypothetical protein